jgi:hypothetical protein
MSAEDVIMVGAVIFALAIAFFASHFVLNTMYTSMIGNPQLNSSAQAVSVLQAGKQATNQMDYVVFGVFIALVLGIIITGWFVGGSTIFMVLYFFVWIIAVILAAVFSNTWETISQASIFGSTISSFPITNNIMANLPVYLAVVGFLGIIAMFAKPYFAQSGGGSNEY